MRRTREFARAAEMDSWRERWGKEEEEEEVEQSKGVQSTAKGEPEKDLGNKIGMARSAARQGGEACQ